MAGNDHGGFCPGFNTFAGQLTLEPPRFAALLSALSFRSIGMDRRGSTWRVQRTSQGYPCCQWLQPVLLLLATRIGKCRGYKVPRM
jgi:hypothetical protein